MDDGCCQVFLKERVFILSSRTYWINVLSLILIYFSIRTWNLPVSCLECWFPAILNNFTSLKRTSEEKEKDLALATEIVWRSMIDIEGFHLCSCAKYEFRTLRLWVSILKYASKVYNYFFFQDKFFCAVMLLDKCLQFLLSTVFGVEKQSEQQNLFCSLFQHALLDHLLLSIIYTPVHFHSS